MSHSSTSTEQPTPPVPPPPPPPVAAAPAAQANRATKKTLVSKKTTPMTSTERWRDSGPAVAPAKNEPVKNDPAPNDADSQEVHGDPEDERGHGVERSAPAWLISLIIHLVMLLLFAILTLPATGGIGRILIELGESEEGEDIALTSFALEGPETPDILEIAEEVVEVEQEIVIEQVTPTEIAEFAVPTEVGAVEVSQALARSLSGRSGAAKDALLAAYGGNQATKEAVELGLKWLKRVQHSSGQWKLSGRFSDGSNSDNGPAATAMALLAFQGDGNTHQSGPYAKEVEKGIKWLLNRQDREGSFVTKPPRIPAHEALYAQGQCTIAICELYAMTKDSRLREPAQRAVNWAVENQSKEGGWRYYPGRDTDTSVTGWFLMGLQSARMAGLEVPESTFDRIKYWLEEVSHYDGSAYSYQPNQAPSKSMTAEGLLCRQYLGWDHDNPALVEAVMTIDENYNFDYDERNFYYWYYATQVLHHFGGSPWWSWNSRMRDQLPNNQVKVGKEAGSWSPQGSEWGSAGGRLYTTCMAIYCLEVYYRHMPLYDHSKESSKE